MAKHTIMREFRLGEISGVDRPAQKGAKAHIIKRDLSDGAEGWGGLLAKSLDGLTAATIEYAKRTFTADQRQAAASSGAAMPDGSFPIKNRDDLENAIRLAGHAKDPAKAKSHIIARARSLDATSMLPGDWKAAKSIGGDLVMEIARVAPRALPGILDDINKVEEIEAEVAKRADKVERENGMRDCSIAKTAVIASAWSVLDTMSPEDAVSLLQKNFAEYKDHVQGLAVSKGDGDMKAIAKALGLAETATEAEITAAVIKLAGGEIAVLKADLAKSSTINSFNGAQRAFYDKADDAGKTAFVAATDSAARDALIKAKGGKTQAEMDDEEAEKAKKSKGGDECIKVDGTNIFKRDVGDSTFLVLKSQQAAIEKAATDVAISTITKRIEPMKFVVGKADDTAGVLHRIGKGTSTQADADAVESLLKSANAIMVKSEVITKEFGKQGGNGEFAKAADAIDGKARELQKADAKLSIEKARTMVRTMHPELAKQEETERADQRRAA